MNANVMRLERSVAVVVSASIFVELEIERHKDEPGGCN